MDYETEFNTDVTEESSPSTESEITQDTAEEAGEPISKSSVEEQADIQDGTPSEQNVPYDRFKEINDENKYLREQLNKVLELQLGNKQQQVQPEQKTPDFDIDDDAFLTGADVKRLLMTLEAKRQQETQTFTQTSREQMLMQHEEVFRQGNPDYDTVIKNIPVPLAKALMESIQNPSELIAEAYRLGRAYSPQKATAAEIATKATPQKQPKPVTLNNVKGSVTPKEATTVSFEQEFRSSIGR